MNRRRFSAVCFSLLTVAGGGQRGALRRRAAAGDAERVAGHDPASGWARAGPRGVAAERQTRFAVGSSGCRRLRCFPRSAHNLEDGLESLDSVGAPRSELTGCPDHTGEP